MKLRFVTLKKLFGQRENEIVGKRIVVSGGDSVKRVLV